MTEFTAVPPPVSGETLPSWLDRISAANGMTLAWTLHMAGMAASDDYRSMPLGYGHHLPTDHVQRLAAITGTHADTITGMLTQSWVGTWAQPVCRDGRDVTSDARQFGHKNWLYLTGSHYCPDCLAENRGAWLLDWKIPFTYACTTHRRLLLATCPECGIRASEGRREHGLRPQFPAYVPEPGTCRNPRMQEVKRSVKGPCGHDHATDQRGILLPGWLIETQIKVHASPVTPQTATDMRALAAYAITTITLDTVQHILGDDLPEELSRQWDEQRSHRLARLEQSRASGTDHRRFSKDTVGRKAPTDPILMATATAVAKACLADDTALRALIDAGKVEDPTAALPHLRIRGLSASDDLNARITEALHGPAAALIPIGMHSRYPQATLSLDPDGIPPYLWDDLYDAFVEAKTTGMGFHRYTLRRFASIAIHKTATGLTWAESTLHFSDRHLSNPRLAINALSRIKATAGPQALAGVLQAITEAGHALAHDPRTATYAENRNSATRVFSRPMSAKAYRERFPGDINTPSRRMWASVQAWADAVSDHPVNAPAWGPDGPSPNDLEGLRRWRSLER